jgi:1-acyl-sn-glycerol-3-phosphate acyltransferase
MILLRKSWRLFIFVVSLLLLGATFFFLSPWRGRSADQFRLKIFSRWARDILKTLKIRVYENVFEEFKGDKTPRVIVSNHVSYLDIPVIASLGPTLFLAKREVSQWPLMGQIGKSLGMLFVDRARLASRAQSIRDIQSQVQQGFSVTIFPEGTTSETGPQLGRVPFHSGAFRVAREAGVPVEVIYLEYSDLEACVWVGKDSFVRHLWQFLGVKAVSVKVRREWLVRVENRAAQREAFFWSRKWMLEGGHGFLSDGPARS